MNGPDVKIRGTAAHIAEKYMSLARDALSSGDIVAAESYFQHAEHYNRIIMAAQSQMGPQHGQHQGEGPNGGFRQQPRWNADGSEDDGDFDAGEGGGAISVRAAAATIGDRVAMAAKVPGIPMAPISPSRPSPTTTLPTP